MTSEEADEILSGLGELIVDESPPDPEIDSLFNELENLEIILNKSVW